MNLIDPSEDRREVEHLHRLAMDACSEGHYATMERLLEPAAETAERLDDLPLLVRERFWLASARRMQGKYTQAITTYIWLIGLATDLDQSRRLADQATLSYLACGFQDFLDCGRFLPELPVEGLLRVAADGLAWLDRVGKSHWTAGLRNQRGLLHREWGEKKSARLDLEAALCASSTPPRGARVYPVLVQALPREVAQPRLQSPCGSRRVARGDPERPGIYSRRSLHGLPSVAADFRSGATCLIDT